MSKNKKRKGANKIIAETNGAVPGTNTDPAVESDAQQQAQIDPATGVAILAGDLAPEKENPVEEIAQETKADQSQDQDKSETENQTSDEATPDDDASTANDNGGDDAVNAPDATTAANTADIAGTDAGGNKGASKGLAEYDFAKSDAEIAKAKAHIEAGGEKDAPSGCGIYQIFDIAGAAANKAFKFYAQGTDLDCANEYYWLEISQDPMRDIEKTVSHYVNLIQKSPDIKPETLYIEGVLRGFIDKGMGDFKSFPLAVRAAYQAFYETVCMLIELDQERLLDEQLQATANAQVRDTSELDNDMVDGPNEKFGNNLAS